MMSVPKSSRDLTAVKNTAQVPMMEPADAIPLEGEVQQSSQWLPQHQ